MASRTDSERFERALEKWDDLQEAGHFSVPQEIGRCAVLVAYNYHRDLDPGVRDPFPIYVKDALNVCDNLAEQGKDVELSIDTSHDDFRAVMRDEKFSDVVVIGNGVLSRVFLTAAEKRIGWGHVSHMTNHLKTGRFVQRFCGRTPDKLNVPMGLMAVSSHANVHAPVWDYFAPTSTDSTHEKRIRPVTTKSRMSLADIKESFPQQQSYTFSREQRVAYTLNSLRRLAILSARAV
jgi:hypothetical protein